MTGFETFLASITITIVSGHTDKQQKEWRDKNFSGCYRMVEIVNDRPAYKVSLTPIRESWKKSKNRELS